VRARNPGIVYCSISGFGQTGPYRDRAAMDLIVQAESGMISVTGEPGSHGVRCGVSIADMTAGMHAAFGILAALHSRGRTGRGQFLDVSMLESQLGLLDSLIATYLADGIVPTPMGTAYKALLPYQTFRTRTKDIAVAVGSDGLWRTFCPLLGIDDMRDDPRYATNRARSQNRESLIARLEETFLTRTYEEWEAILLPAGVPYTGPSSGVMLPGAPTRPAAPAADATPKIPDSTPAEAAVVGSVRAPSLAAATSRTLDPAGPLLQSPAHPAGADKLPAAVGSAGLRAAAVKGDAAAEYEIAVRFAEGRGIPQDLTTAAEWFERSAKQGLVPAQFRLGALYEKGMGVKKDTENARRLYAAAGQAGNAKAMHNLAVLYAEGVDGKPDYQTAAKWFRKAADYGVSDSQYNLGILYARGIGIEPNLAEAYKWFALAAREGDNEAAKKRDDVGARLDQSSLMAARVAAQVWSAEPQPETATLVKVPAGGWDAAAAVVPPAAKRRGGPKADAPQRPAQ